MKKVILFLIWLAFVTIAKSQNQSYTICPGAITTLTANMYPGLTNMSYSIQPGGTVSAGQTFTVNPYVNTNYTLYTTGNNGSANVTYTQGVILYVTDMMSHSITSAQNFTLGCGSASIAVVHVTAVNTSFNGDAFTYSVLPPGSGNIQPGPLLVNTNFTVNTPGTYTAVFRSAIAGCYVHLPFFVVQNTSGPVLDSIKGDLLLNCFKPSTTLQAVVPNGGFNVTFTWTAPGPTTVVGDMITVKTLTAAPVSTLIANLKLTLQYQSSKCISNYTIQMKQNTYPPIALIGSTGTLTCKQPMLELTNQSKTGIPLNSGYPTNGLVVASLWDGPGIGPPLANSSTYTVFVPGVYTLTATDLNNGCTGKTTVYVGEDKVVPLISSSSPGNICGNITTATLAPVIISSTTNLSYTWTVPANAITSNINALTLTTNMLGVYALNVTNNKNGCAATETMQVVQCVGIYDFENTGIKIYPNPAIDVLNFSSEESWDLEFILMDVNGKVVMKRMVSSNEQINIQQLEKGVYFVDLVQGGKVRDRFRVVKM